MTQDIDSGHNPNNYFNLQILQTEHLEDENVYLQKTLNTRDDTYTILYREDRRYGAPKAVSENITQEKDADQLLQAAQNDWETLKQTLTRGDR